MNLSQIRSEVLARGFDPTLYSARITQFINDGQNLIARRVDYYENDSTSLFSTVAQTQSYAWPAGFARMRSLSDTGRRVELEYVSIRDIDRVGLTYGAPSAYALVGQQVALFPIPDGVYSLQMRYWQMPAQLVGDTDVPNLPSDYHNLLWVYATWQCYEAEDDSQMGQYWQQRFNNDLSEFTADVKFPDTDGPTQARGMWDSDQGLSANGWSLYGTGW